MKILKIILLLFIASNLQAQSWWLGNGNSFWYSLEDTTDNKYLYVNNPNELDLNGANNLADSNSVFTTTVGDWVASGDVAIDTAGGKMEVVATGTQDTDYVSSSQDNFTDVTEHGKNYTIQLGASSDGTLGSNISRTFVNGSGSPTIDNDTIDFIDEASSVKDLSYWEIGKHYKIIATVTNYSGSGNINLPYDGSIVSLQASANGIYTIDDYSPAGDDLWVYSFSGHTATVVINSIQEITYSDYYVKLGNIIDTFSTTGTEQTQAITMQYDSVGMTVLDGIWEDGDSDGLADDWVKNSTVSATFTDGNQILERDGSSYGGFYRDDGVSINTYNKVTIRYRGNDTKVRWLYDGNVVTLNNAVTNWQDTTFIIDASTVHRIFLTLNNEATVGKWFEVDYIKVEELPSLQIFPLSNDTYTFDDVDVSEAYDLEIEGWFLNKNDGGYARLITISDGTTTGTSTGLVITKDDANKIEVYTYQSDGGSAHNAKSTTTVADSLWHSFKFNITHSMLTLELDDVLEDTNTIDMWNINNSFPLKIGIHPTTTAHYWDGQIGRISFTRTNGLGATTGYSYFDWSGTTDTYIDDKGTSGNDLIMVNSMDRYKYKKLYLGTPILFNP